jgi:tRNA A37 N6-isopentenylltransferase MiaA
MIRRGLIEEVAAVLAEGHAATSPGLDGIGIREAVEYLHGNRERDTVAEAITVGTRQYAKRQQTWFRHQLGGGVVTLDATRPPERLAREIAQMWERAGSWELGARSAANYEQWVRDRLKMKNSMLPSSQLPSS